jgi:hypothetical protein
MQYLQISTRNERAQLVGTTATTQFGSNYVINYYIWAVGMIMWLVGSAQRSVDKKIDPRSIFLIPTSPCVGSSMTPFWVWYNTAAAPTRPFWLDPLIGCETV